MRVLWCSIIIRSNNRFFVCTNIFFLFIKPLSGGIRTSVSLGDEFFFSLNRSLVCCIVYKLRNERNCRRLRLNFTRFAVTRAVHLAKTNDTCAHISRASLRCRHIIDARERKWKMRNGDRRLLFSLSHNVMRF